MFYGSYNIILGHLLVKSVRLFHRFLCYSWSFYSKVKPLIYVSDIQTLSGKCLLQILGTQMGI